jgi:hypothetical protein
MTAGWKPKAARGSRLTEFCDLPQEVVIAGHRLSGGNTGEYEMLEEIEVLAAGGKWSPAAAKKIIVPGENGWRSRAIQYAVACFNSALEQDDFSLIKFHPLAEIFPPMEAGDFAALKSSIAKDSTIREQISVAPDGRIVDGSNRVRALFELVKCGMDFRMTEHHVDCPIQNPRAEAMGHDEFLMHLVIAKNLARRQLTPRQKAAFIAKSTDVMSREESGKASAVARGEREIKQNEPTSKSDAERAKDAGIGLSTIKRARKVRADDPEMADAEIKGRAAEAELKKKRKQAKPAKPASEPKAEFPEAKKKAISALFNALDRYGSLWGFDDQEVISGVNKIIAGYRA